MDRSTLSGLAYPLVVAHRGASSTRPENTLGAFRAALDAGAQVVELDVRLTADGVPVIMHDADVSRTTDGHGLVHELALGQVKTLNAAPGAPEPAEVPTLAEVLQDVRGRGGLNLEIKNLPGHPGFEPGRESIVEACLEELAGSGFDGPILISSFNPASIARARELGGAELATGLLTTESVDAEAALAHVVEHGHDFVLPNVRALIGIEERFVADAHAAGVRVGTWTVDDADTIRRLFGSGVDAVATNDPEMAVAVRSELVRADRD